MKIDHPQVYLYSYQLSRESDTDSNSIWTWADKLWKKFNVNNNYPNNFSKENCQQFLLNKAKKFDFSSSINGSLRCCRLHDSEGILARVGSPENDDNRDLSLEIFKTFNPDHVLVPVNDSKWLGQTILITYKLKTLVTPSSEQFQELANNIVQNLLGDKPSVTSRSTQLFGSPIVEYSSLDLLNIVLSTAHNKSLSMPSMIGVKRISSKLSKVYLSYFIIATKLLRLLEIAEKFINKPKVFTKLSRKISKAFSKEPRVAVMRSS